VVKLEALLKSTLMLKLEESASLGFDHRFRRWFIVSGFRRK